MSDHAIMELVPMALFAVTTIFIIGMVLCYRVIRMVIQSRYGGALPGKKERGKQNLKDGPISQRTVDVLADRALELAHRIETLEEILRGEKQSGS